MSVGEVFVNVDSDLIEKTGAFSRRHLLIGSLRGDLLLISLAITLLSLALPISLLQIYDRILPNHAFGTLGVIGAGVLLAIMLEGGLRYARMWSLNRMGSQYDAWAHTEALRCLLLAPKSTSLSRLAIEDGFSGLGQMREYFSGQALLALFDAPFVLLFLAMIAYVAGAVVFIPIAALLLVFFLVALEGRALAVDAHAAQVGADKRSHFLQQVFDKLLPLKSLGIESRLDRRFESLHKDYAQQRAGVDERMIRIQSLVAILSQASTIMVVIFSAHLVISGELTSGGLAAATFMSGRCMAPVGALFSFWGRYQSTLQAHDRASVLLTHSDSPEINTGARVELGQPVGVSINGLQFGDEAPIHCSIQSGSCVHLTRNDWGDSAKIFRHLSGEQLAQAGSCAMNVADSIEPVNSQAVAIASVNRQSHLFSGSVLDNLTLFDRTKEPSAYDWSERLGLDQRIKLLPQGYQTQLFLGASSGLDAGTVQLLAIARALVSSPALLLLDHADAAMDLASQKVLAQLLTELKSAVTIIMLTNSEVLMAASEPVTVKLDSVAKEACS